MSETRRSILEHLNTLVTTVAVVGALSSEGTACRGYGVVDPMPSPALCPGVAATIKATAAWIDTPAGRRLEVILARPTRADASFGDAKNGAADKQRVESAEATPDGGLRFVIAPLPADKFLEFYTATYHCQGANGPIEAAFAFRIELVTADGGPAATPTVSVEDR